MRLNFWFSHYMNKRKRNIEKFLAEDSFVRWINNEADSTETIFWQEWLSRDPLNVWMYEEAAELYRDLRFEEEDAETAAELEKLEKSLLRSETLAKFKTRGRNKRTNYRYLFALAAILLLAFMALWNTQKAGMIDSDLTQNNYVKIETKYGQIQRIQFPGESSVILNANSTLRYSEPFLNDQTTLYLEGEAYFDIQAPSDSQGEPRELKIYTPDGMITILGTKFNVNTRDGLTTVVLEQGKVNLVKNPAQTGQVEKSYLMSPGELALFSNSGDGFQVRNVHTDLYTSWTELAWVFDNTPLSDIAKRIESTYGLEVIIKEIETAQMKFSGTAPNQNLTVLLEGLKTLLGVPIESDTDTIIIGD